MSAALEAFPEALISGFEHIIPACTNHPEDRHVLAAAVHGKVETIVTFNVRDYTRESTRPWGIQAVHPSDFLKVLYDHDPAVVTNVLHEMSRRATRSMPDMLGRLAWNARSFAEYVAGTHGIELPEVHPTDWRR